MASLTVSPIQLQEQPVVFWLAKLFQSSTLATWCPRSCQIRFSRFLLYNNEVFFFFKGLVADSLHLSHLNGWNTCSISVGCRGYSDPGWHGTIMLRHPKKRCWCLLHMAPFRRLKKSRVEELVPKAEPWRFYLARLYFRSASFGTAGPF